MSGWFGSLRIFRRVVALSMSCVVVGQLPAISSLTPPIQVAAQTVVPTSNASVSSALRLVDGQVPGELLTIANAAVSNELDDAEEIVDISASLPGFAGGAFDDLCVSTNGSASLDAECFGYDGPLESLQASYSNGVYLAPLNTDQKSDWGKVLADDDARLPSEAVFDVGVLVDVVSVSAGENHSCAVTSVHEVFCWGAGSSGQLGNGSTTNQSWPVQVTGVGGDGVLTDVVSVSAGGFHSCAVTSGDEVFCWGAGPNGELGNGSTTNQSSPVQVTGVGGDGVLADVVSVSAGGFHSCAVTSGDEVFCWGLGSSGRLGNGLTENQSSPVQVTGVGGDGVLTDVVSVSAGENHSCAVTSGDEAFCWGSGSYGQLGGAQSLTSTPIQVAAGEAPGRSKLLLGNGGGTLSWASSWFEAGDCVRFAGTGTTLDTAGSLRVVSVVDGTGSIDIDGYDIGVAPVRGTGVFSDCVGLPSTISVATDQLVNGRRSVIVTWYRMPNYNSDSTTGDANTYQMVIIERGDDAFDVEFNYGSLTESQSDRGYSAGDGTRLPIGWFSKADGELVESHELAGAVDAADLVDEGARALVDNSLNSNVAGRYVIPFRSGSAVPEAWIVPAMDGTATFAPGFAPGGAPTAVSATTSDTSADVSWTPGSDGVADTTGYSVTTTPGDASCVTTSTSCTVEGLTTGVTYTFSVVAQTSAGASPAGSVSATTTVAVSTTVPSTSVAPTLAVLEALPQAVLSTSPMYLGGTIAATYTGFSPGETVQLVIASTPLVIGTAVANESGSVTVSGELPLTIGVGEHTVALYAPSSGTGFRQTVTTSAATLPATGSNAVFPVGVGAVLFIIGVGMMATRRDPMGTGRR